MKLSLCVLRNWLIPFHPELETLRECEKQICSEDCICIENVRLFNGQASADGSDPSTMYVGRQSDFFCSDSEKVICRYTNSTLFLETTDIISVFNEILNAFRYYEEWHMQLMHLLDQRGTLTELLDLSEPIIENPLIVFDSSDSVLAYSSKYENESLDEAWSSLIRNRYSPSHYALPFHNEKNTMFDQYNHEPYFTGKEFFPRNTYSQNIFYEKRWCGICAMIENETKFDIGRMHLFKILCEHIQLWVNKQTSDAIFKLDSSLFSNLIRGTCEDISGLRRKLQIRGWNAGEDMILLTVKPIADGYNTQQYLCSVFADISDYIYAVIFETNILLLCNVTSFPKKTLYDQLSPWLKKSGYHCGVSYPFSDVNEIPAAYQQAEAAFVHGEKKNRGSVGDVSDALHSPVFIHEIENYSISWIMDCIHTNMETFMMHPALSKIRSYDQKHHSFYYETLFCYLNNERNIKITAEQMNIHRNTLLQRISRLTDHFQIDFTDADERFYLLLSFRYARAAQDSRD